METEIGDLRIGFGAGTSMGWPAVPTRSAPRNGVGMNASWPVTLRAMHAAVDNVERELRRLAHIVPDRAALVGQCVRQIQGMRLCFGVAQQVV